jgi:hypothetical protein
LDPVATTDTIGGLVAGTTTSLGESIGTGKGSSQKLSISSRWPLWNFTVIIIIGWMVHPSVPLPISTHVKNKETREIKKGKKLPIIRTELKIFALFSKHTQKCI